MSKDDDRDIVRELHEDAQWSSWTNSIERWRGRSRGPRPRDPSIRTFIVAAILVIGAVVGAIGILVLLLNLS